jgi:hypothetical protein
MFYGPDAHKKVIHEDRFLTLGHPTHTCEDVQGNENAHVLSPVHLLVLLGPLSDALFLLHHVFTRLYVLERLEMEPTTTSPPMQGSTVD